MRSVTRRAFLMNAAAATLSAFQTKVDAAERSVQVKATESPVSVFDFLTEAEKADILAGTQLLNVRTNVARAFSAHKHIYFPAGSYFLGNVSKNERIFDIDGAGGKLTILSEGMVRFVCNTTDYSIPQFFHIANADGVKIGTFHFHDNGYDNTSVSVKWKGAAGIMFSVTGGGTKTVKNVEIDEVYCKSMVHTVACAGNFLDVRIRGIKINKIDADTCYYGFSCQNNGDAVEISRLNTRNVKRSYFVYGVTGHTVNVYSRNNQNSTGDINISCNNNSVGTGPHTSDLDVHYTCVSPRNILTLVNINALGEEKRKIENIRLHLDIASSTPAEIISIKTYTSAAFPPIKENRGTTNNIYDDISIEGRISAPLAPNYLEIKSRPTTRGRIYIGAGIDASRIARSVPTHFDISPAR